MPATRNKTPDVFINNIKNPARAGPTILVKFILELFKEIAFISLLSGTISEISACLLGMLQAISVPLNIPMVIICQNVTMSEKSRSPSMNVRIALPNWLQMTMFFLDIRSASTPAKGDTIVIGMANDNVTNASASGESPDTLRTSHPRVIICIFMARKELNEPTHIHRKSLKDRDSKNDFGRMFIPGFGLGS